jgi:hypothetical protein
MQAPCSISASQRNSIESVFTCLTGCSALLGSLKNPLGPEDGESARAVSLWAELCQRKLLESFPELHIWLSESTREG